MQFLEDAVQTVDLDAHAFVSPCIIYCFLHFDTILLVISLVLTSASEK